MDARSSKSELCICVNVCDWQLAQTSLTVETQCGHSLKIIIDHRTSSYRPSFFQHTSNVIPHEVKKIIGNPKQKGSCLYVYVNVMQVQGLYSPLNSSTFNLCNFALNTIYSDCIEYTHVKFNCKSWIQIILKLLNIIYNQQQYQNHTETMYKPRLCAICTIMSITSTNTSVWRTYKEVLISTCTRNITMISRCPAGITVPISTSLWNTYLILWTYWK